MSVKAVALISGGLDSALSAKVIKLQGIEVIGLSFVTPFVNPQIKRLAQNIAIEIKLIDVSLEYLDLIRNPRFGFGSNMNPCIDCHIFMLRKARESMSEYNADFVISGEVLGQRPMSQNRITLKKIEKESGLEGLLLRPLSARLLEPTVAENNSWVKRDRLFDFSGRSRKPQMQLAEELGLDGYSQPAGGCLLTDPAFSRRLKDLLNNKQELNLDNINLLKLGRHFRLSDDAKLIVGRNQEENERILNVAKSGNIVLRPIGVAGPVGILETEKFSEKLIELSARILAAYCDNDGNNTFSISIEGNGRKLINCSAQDSNTIDSLRL